MGAVESTSSAESVGTLGRGTGLRRMGKNGSVWRHVLGSLRTRLVLFLTLALLPIGAVAVYQTSRVIHEAQRLAERDVLARTVGAASELQGVLQRAFGAAEGLGIAAYRSGPDTPGCTAVMEHFIRTHVDYSFAGFVSRDGTMSCTNTGEVIEYAGTKTWDSFSAEPRPRAFVSRNGDISRQPVLVAFVPIFDPATGAFLGAQAVSTPEWLTEALLEASTEDVTLALVAPDGERLVSAREWDGAFPLRDADLRPGALDVPPGGRFFDAEMTGGVTQVALVPLIADWIYVAGIWDDPGRRLAAPVYGGWVAAMFPILMWLASLVVAYLAVDQLVLRNLDRLSVRMRQFRSDRQGDHVHVRQDAPDEIVTIAESYNAMVDRIASDHAAMQRNMREKELLLREIHHRVKNNLQLIASILNMQIRTVNDPEARRILTRVQERVMSLSAIHKALYSGERVDSIRADLLLAELIDGVLNVALPRRVGAEVTVDLEPVRLDPDRLVPLSLLVTEAVTNAARHLGTTDGRPLSVAVSLAQEGEDGTIVFTTENSRGPDRVFADASDGSALGTRLIEAFAGQLAGNVSIEEDARRHRLELRFRPDAVGH